MIHFQSRSSHIRRRIALPARSEVVPANTNSDALSRNIREKKTEIN